MTITTQPYEPRSIRFLELWCEGEWRLKVYGIACGHSSPRPGLIEAAKLVTRKTLAAVSPNLNHYSVGFLGIHDGRTANFVFVDWWANENELHHHVYVSPTAEPARLVNVTGTGLAACVWDLRVMGFERQAWLDTILRNGQGADFEAYLNQRLNEET